VASAGGVWSALVHGFGGMRDHLGDITFDPRLPVDWESLTFRITLKDTRLRVTLLADAINFEVEVGSSATVHVRGEPVEITSAGPVSVALAGQGPRIDGEPEPRALRDTARADGTVITASVPHVSGRNR